jgi:hypothetical protein
MEARDAVERDQVLRVGAGDRQVVDAHVAGRIVRTHIGDVGAVLDAAHLDRLLRGAAGLVDRDIVDGQILVVAEQQDIRAPAGRAAHGRVVVEFAVEDRHRADGVAVSRGRPVASTDISEAVLLGVGNRHAVESHRAREVGGSGRDEDAVVLAEGVDIEIGDGERAIERAGNGDLAVEVYRAATGVTVDGDGLVGDGYVFGVGAGCEDDRVAIYGSSDRCLDRGEGATNTAKVDIEDAHRGFSFSPGICCASKSWRGPRKRLLLVVVHGRAPHVVGARGKARRRPGPTASAWLRSSPWRYAARACIATPLARRVSLKTLTGPLNGPFVWMASQALSDGAGAALGAK